MDQALLQTVWQLAEEVFRPRAAEADQGNVHHVLDSNIQRLSGAGFFGLGIPPRYGGLGADQVTRHEYTEILASACGVTAFTQQQFQTGIKFITESRNEALKRELLPALAAGRLRCGIALSHLRRPGTPLMRADRMDGGYRLNGRIPWVTGWALLHGFVLGARLGDGEHLFAFIDKTRHRAALTAGQTLPLIVMEASDTVEVEVCDLFIPEEYVLTVEPSAGLQRTDLRSLTSQAALPLGNARAGARYLQDLARLPGREALARTAVALIFEIDHCRREVLTWNCDCVDHPEYMTYALRARATAIVLAMRAAYATVVATGGRAHLKTAAPQRLLREAQFYATAVQTGDIQAATLDQLISPFFGL